MATFNISSSQDLLIRESGFITALNSAVARSVASSRPSLQAHRFAIAVKDGSIRFPEKIRGSLPFTESYPNSSVVEVKRVTPVLEDLSLTKVSNPNIVVFISRLLVNCSPSAIISKVTKRVIDTFKGVIGSRSFPHVFIKLFKPLPSSTNGNALPNVHSIMPNTAAHAFPNRVFWDFRFNHEHR